MCGPAADPQDETTSLQAKSEQKTRPPSVSSVRFGGVRAKRDASGVRHRNLQNPVPCFRRSPAWDR
eukprot:14179875-Alexandrium_andersonii.AAC.1